MKTMVNLGSDDIPSQWYNIIPDLPEQLPPPQDPKDGPSRIQNLPNLMIGECLKQEFSIQNWIDIPGGIMDLYAKAGRPRPLFRATNLEKRLDTPARLYYKSEFFSPTGSHKVNTALAQCWYAKQQGFERVTTETGAGQWGTALAYAAAVSGLKCTVYWVRSVYNWKQDRLSLMKFLGADVHASPSPATTFGRSLYEKNPEHVGSLGIAISEGLEDSQRDPKATYCLGSVLNHVLMHQTIIGLETQKQFELFDDYPDVVISCLGGGSNFGGFALPFMGDVLTKRKKIQFIAAQSQVAPNLQGKYEYDFADYAELTPMLKM
ncbi:MAG: TrpB-like pyridoxal phosphate-dependent enzyme, partial [Bacteroidota bacterium]